MVGAARRAGGSRRARETSPAARKAAPAPGSCCPERLLPVGAQPQPGRPAARAVHLFTVTSVQADSRTPGLPLAIQNNNRMDPMAY